MIEKNGTARAEPPGGIRSQDTTTQQASFILAEKMKEALAAE